MSVYRKILNVKERGSSDNILLDYCTMEVHMSILTFQRCAENALFALMDTLLTALNHQRSR